MNGKNSFPEMKSGIIIQETILFRRLEDYYEFEKIAMADQKYKITEKAAVCILPKETKVQIQDEQHSGCLKIKVDLSQFENFKLPESLTYEQLKSGVINGVVLDFAVISI